MFVAPNVTHSAKNSNLSLYERPLPPKDDGVRYQISGYTAQYFPVRPLIRMGESDGAWLVAHKAEERRKFNELLRRRDVTRRPDKSPGTRGTVAREVAGGLSDTDEEPACLDGFYLLRAVRVEDPAFVCHVDISGSNLTDIKEEDLQLFDSVTSLKAGENLLRIEPLNGFPNLRELEIPFNGLRNLKLTASSFPNLEFLDVSYNELTKDDLFNIGLLKRLRRLHAGGNGLSELPDDMALPEIATDGDANQRFQSLECLMLDDNRLSDPKAFASLATLTKLKVLSLEKNEFTGIPYLKVAEETEVDIEELTTTATATGAATTSAASTSRGRRGRKSARGATSSRRQNRQRASAAHDDDEAAGDADAEVDAADLVVVASRKPAVSRLPDQEDVVAAVTMAATVEQPGAELPEESGEPKPPSASTGEINRGVEELNLQLMRINRPASAPMVELAPFDLREIERDIGRRILDQRRDDRRAAGPFPALRSLNIGGNRVAREESLVACGVWHALEEILVHENPLCRTRSGELPLLQRLLTNRLGIRVLRQKPQQGPKPRIEVEQKPSRKVASRIPRVPKVDVDTLLLGIMAPPQKGSQSQQQARKDGEDAGSDWGDEAEGQLDGGGGAGVFLTSVSDQAAEAAGATVKSTEPKGATAKAPEPENQDDEETDDIDLLLSGAFGDDNADDDPLPQDVLGSVKALQYLLDHPVTLDHARPPLAEAGAAYREHRAVRRAPAPAPPRPTRAELARAAAEATRHAEPRVELPLAGLLKPTEKPLPPLRDRRRLEGPPRAEVRSLLGGVQRRYQAVRDRSLQQAKEQAREKIAFMVEDIRDGVRKSLMARQAADEVATAGAS